MISCELSRHLELRMIFGIGMASVVRRFVETVAERLGVSDDASVGIALATHELCENVAKYGVGCRGTVCLDVRRDADGARIVLSVTSEAHPNDIDGLKQRFREMEKAPDPMTYYVALMGKEAPKGESGLGLARIRAEADMTLGLAVDAGLVTVSAVSLPFSLVTQEAP